LSALPLRMRFPLLHLPLALLCSACASLLPSAQTDSSTFTDFDEARSAVEVLVPMQSNWQSITMGSLNPASHPNVSLLTQADIVRRFFVPNTLLTRQDLDPGVLSCVAARGSCRGIELNISKISKVRTGNFIKDVANFSRRTEISGWRFNATILLVDDLVVYRTWGGQPWVKELEVTHNPLGPLQDIGVSGLVKPCVIGLIGALTGPQQRGQTRPGRVAAVIIQCTDSLVSRSAADRLCARAILACVSA
jgi:hypothetical protein